MTQEERLFGLIGNLPDDLTCQTEIPQKTRRKISPKTRNRWIGVAACLVAAVGIWRAAAYSPSDTLDCPFSSESAVTESQPVVPEAPKIKLNWPKVSGNSSEAALSYTMLPVNDHAAEYHQVENPRGIAKAQRPEYLGEGYLDLDGWYLPADTDALRYLIHREKDGSYTLWEFSSFLVMDQEELDELTRSVESGENAFWSGIDWFRPDMDFSPYFFGEVLETVYGVAGPEDIKSVTVSPANMDNTDAGKALQKEIGTITITDRARLDAFYAAIVSMDCYGSDRWELIDLGKNDPEDGLLTCVRLCRYLSIELADGSLIDALKYSAAGGQFYEYCGIAYEPLAENITTVLNDIFEIEA